ncbi:MAG: hypothetical protein SFW07_06460 [Gammaproteobacteria bacterium]|nr:hypothetical protein [Gammaproteobacteria bacterium]
MSREKERVYEYEALDNDLGGRCIPSNDQNKCRYVYYHSLRAGVYQFDPISKKEKHFKLFEEDADFFNKRQDHFLWTDDHYLVASSFRLDSREMGVHFFEIQKERLKFLSSIQFDQFNGVRPGLVTVLSSPKIVLFNQSMFGALYVWFIDTGKCLAVEGRGNSELGSISLLQFLNEGSFLAIHGQAGIVCCWNILEDRLEKSWEFEDKALINYKTKKSIHSDKLIILPPEENFLTVIDIITGQKISSISSPNGKERKITVLGRISDDQILLCDSDGGRIGYDNDTLIYNIRTERVDYRVKRDSPFSSASLNPAVCERFTSLSPTQVLVEGLSQKHLLSMEKDGVLTVSDCYRAHREYSLSHVVTLGNGYVFSAPMHPSDDKDTAPPTVLIKLKNFNNAIHNNISSRTWSAIALALVCEKTFPVDLMVMILSLVRSGYETRYQLAKIGFFSRKLAICARDMVAKHFNHQSGALVKSFIPKK